MLFHLYWGLFGQNNPMIHYTMESGLPHKTVFSALNDKQGYMWFGTSAGVVRFDGYNWEHFTSEDGLSDNDVLKIFQDKKGRIWFLTFNGTFCYYFNGKFYNPENSSILKLASVKSGTSSVYEDSNENKWMVPIDNDYFVSINDFEVKHHRVPDYKKNVKGFVFELNEELLLLTNKLFFVFENDEFIPTTKEYPVPYNHRSHCIVNDVLYYLSSEGIIRLSSDGYEVVVPVEDIPQLSNLSTLHVDSKGHIWLCTMNDGVYNFSDYQTDVKVKQFLKNEVIASCIDDKDGNVWFTTISNGVFMMPYNFTNSFSLTTENGLNTNRIHSITKESNGTIWLGAENGYVFKYYNNNITSIDLNKILEQRRLVYNHVVNIIKRNNEVFVHTNNGVVYFKDDGKYNLHLIDSKGRFTYSPKKMTLDSQGRLIVSHTLGVSEIVSSNEGYTLVSINGMPKTRAYTHTVDYNGDIWFVTKGGVYRNVNGNVDEYNIKGFKINQRVKDITVLTDSMVILTTNGQGAVFCQNNEYKYRLTKNSGLSSNVLSKLFVQNDTIWINSTYGLDRINYNNGEINEIVSFKRNSGLPTNHVYDLHLDLNEIYVVSDYGVVELKKEFMNQNLAAPNVYINRVWVSDSLYTSRKIILEKPNNNITIDCSVINFNNQDNVSFQYRLSGVDDIWKNTNHKYFQFASLEPGNYTFEFRAKRNNSEWSDSSHISFQVVLPFWEKPIIIVLYFIIAIIVIALMLFWRSKVKHTSKLAALEQSFQIKSLEQKALQAMMNPHFIFNVLNSIQYYLSLEDAKNAQVNLTRFAKIIRKNLEINQEKFISIDDEIEYLELYLSLEKLRFDDSFKYHITVDDDIDSSETNIPTMLIQPFVENAIWHGIMPQEGIGHIYISFKLDNQCLIIEVFDNGVGYDINRANIKSTHKSVGLKMTRERLSLMQGIYNQDFKLKIEKVDEESSDLSGTRVTLRIPNNIH